MKCPVCDIEMVIYGQREDGSTEYVCRNPNCPKYDGRLKGRRPTKPQ